LSSAHLLTTFATVFAYYCSLEQFPRHLSL